MHLTQGKTETDCIAITDHSINWFILILPREGPTILFFFFLFCRFHCNELISACWKKQTEKGNKDDRKINHSKVCIYAELWSCDWSHCLQLAYSPHRFKSVHKSLLDQGLPLIQKQSYCPPGLLTNYTCLFKSIKINLRKSLCKQGYFTLMTAYLGLA